MTIVKHLNGVNSDVFIVSLEYASDSVLRFESKSTSSNEVVLLALMLTLDTFSIKRIHTD